MSIHIGQVYSCSQVSLACELYYICELGKYSKLLHNKSISLDGVILDTCLKASPIWDYFRMAVDEGWLVNTGVSQDELVITVQHPLDFDTTTIVNFLYTTDAVERDEEDIKKRRASYDYDQRTPIKKQVSFEFMTDDAWKWSVNGYEGKNFIVNNNALNHNRADQSWLSLIAMVAIHRLFTGSPNKFGIELSSNAVLNVMAISYILLLDDETQALTGWCTYLLNDTIPTMTQLQLGYDAWYAKGRDLGLLNKWYSGKEKYEYMKKLDLQTGDLVMFYEREKAQKTNYVKSIAGCHLAKITYLTDDSIGLELINTVKPYYQGKEEFDDNTTIVKNMYCGKPPYLHLSTSKVSYSLADIGVEYYLYTEKYFITPLEDSDDYKITRVSRNGQADTLLLDQNNLIYWILKDYDYEFNEQRFLDRHFKNEEPCYTRYMRGDELENYWYYHDDESVENS